MVPPDNLAILVRENTWNKMNSKLSANRRILITGTAGFIGFHLAKLLLEEGFVVHGYDGMTDYYDVALKQRRHADAAAKPKLCSDRRHAGGSGLFDRVADEFAARRDCSPRGTGRRALQPREPARLPRQQCDRDV